MKSWWYLPLKLRVVKIGEVRTILKYMPQCCADVAPELNKCLEQLNNDIRARLKRFKPGRTHEKELSAEDFEQEVFTQTGAIALAFQRAF